MDTHDKESGAAAAAAVPVSAGQESGTAWKIDLLSRFSAVQSFLSHEEHHNLESIFERSEQSVDRNVSQRTDAAMSAHLER